MAGSIVDLGYELGLHRIYENLRDRSRPTEEEVRGVRLWVTVTIQDYLWVISSFAIMAQSGVRQLRRCLYINENTP